MKRGTTMTDSEASNPSVAITGAGSGLGRELALKLADKGYRVFGTALSPAEVDDLATASGGRVGLSVADITDETAVAKWVDSVTNQLGARGLDVLISNAGILTPGPLEVLSLAAIKREYEVNVFGALAVINAFLPSLRTSRGRIVAIGAMTGRFPLPFNGPSSSTQSRPGSHRRCLPRRAQAVRRALRGGPGRQYGHRRAGQNGRRAATHP